MQGQNLEALGTMRHITSSKREALHTMHARTNTQPAFRPTAVCMQSKARDNVKA